VFYGQAVSATDDEGNAVEYTGRENDETGLYYYRARYYDSVLKQFLSEDPIGIAGGINLRAYVGGNPVSFTDPTGEVAPVLWVALAVAYGFYQGMSVLVNSYNLQAALAQQAAAGNIYGAVQKACQSYPQGGACARLSGSDSK
jgi:RHS repeat-associated protein